MSVGWFIVLLLGFAPIILVYLTSGNNQNNNRQRNGQDNRNNNNSNNSTGGKQVSKKNFFYSNWKIVLLINTFMEDNLQAIKEEHLKLLFTLAKECDLYLVAKVTSDEQEKIISSTVKSSTADGSSIIDAGLNENKILFCETDRGKIAIARQIEPHLYVDSDAEVVKELERFLPLVAQVTPSNTTTIKASSAKITTPSIVELFEAIHSRKV
ncbi:peroxisome biogenesis protein 22 [Acrasis kona]|uniref:Peroxisome biogenesis protein 22 n=1 Tax=Acrasis kona TaxID=1008807 RepID=A0AAW2Z8P6_9EUKA